jgi:hypothetical protein
MRRMGSVGIDLSGGALFTNEPATITHSLIDRNAPERYSGC